MSFLKEYIESSIAIPIKDYMYINVDKLGFVQSYEDYTKEHPFVDKFKINDFLSAYRNVLGLSSKKMTFYKKGFNTFKNLNCINSNINGYEYCSYEIKDPQNNYVIFKPTDFLLEIIAEHKDLFFINLTDLKEFNFLNDALVMQNIEQLDEFFENPEVVRIYKKYTNYYIMN